MARKKKSIKPTTPEQRLYNQIRGKLKGFITREEKKGFMFSADALPKIPKKIKPESISKIQKLWENRGNLYKKSVYGGEATGGMFVSGVKGAKLEAELKKERDRQRRQERRQQRQQPEYYPDTTFTVPDRINEDTSFFDIATIGEYRRILTQYPKVAYPILTQWLDKLINEIGEHLVAVMLNDGLKNGVVLTYEIAYDENKLQDYMAEMENYFWLPTDKRAELTDALESDENFTVY